MRPKQYVQWSNGFQVVFWTATWSAGDNRNSFRAEQRHRYTNIPQRVKNRTQARFDTFLFEFKLYLHLRGNLVRIVQSAINYLFSSCVLQWVSPEIFQRVCWTILPFLGGTLCRCDSYGEMIKLDLTNSDSECLWKSGCGIDVLAPVLGHRLSIKKIGHRSLAIVLICEAGRQLGTYCIQVSNRTSSVFTIQLIKFAKNAL